MLNFLANIILNTCLMKSYEYIFLNILVGVTEAKLWNKFL